MGIKKSLSSLIFVNNDNKDAKPKEKFVSKFPETNTMGNTFPGSGPQTPFMENSTIVAPPVPTLNVPLECAPHMEKIMKLYEDGFASLNKPGVEFYEFFEAVIGGGMDNPMTYKIALKTLSSMEKSMTKDSLISQSQYYVDELTKVHAGYNADGLKKKNDLMADKNSEGQKLQIDIKTIQDQIESLKNQIIGKQTQLAERQNQLSQIDTRYQPKVGELDCKLMANDEAKNRILGTINAIVNGIKANL